jgi:hypothetical protein
MGIPIMQPHPPSGHTHVLCVRLRIDTAALTQQHTQQHEQQSKPDRGAVRAQGTRKNPQTQRFEYLRLGPADCLISPYLPSIMLLWNAHMNIQRVTGESWSRV